jgi:hypothetical protein
MSVLRSLPAPDAPALFESWDDAIHERAFALWSTVAGRNAALTASLLMREAEDGTPTPAASTVRRWAADPDEDWHARADADLMHTNGRSVGQLRAGWLGALTLAQQTLLAGLVGDLDDLPHAGAARLKSAELVLKTLERAGAMIVPQEQDAISVGVEQKLSLAERARRARERIVEGNSAGWG